MKIRPVFPAIVALLALLTGCEKKPEAPLSKPPEVPQPLKPAEPVKPVEDPLTTRVGLFLSMTGSHSSFGADAVNGAMLAADEINASGGLFGHPFKLIVRDTESSTEVTTRVVSELVGNDHVAALIGEIATDRSLAAAPIAQAHGVPMITPGSTNEAVTGTGDCVFRVCYTDSFQAVVMSKFARSMDVGKAAILYDVSTPYSKDLAGIFKNDFLAHRGQIVAEETYRAGDKDFSAQLNALKATMPEIIFLPSYYAEAALIITQARRLGIDVPFLGTDGWDSPEFLRVGGDAVNNCYFSSHFSTESKSPKAVEFVKAYCARFGSAPPPLAALAYDSVYLLVDALKRSGSTEPVALKKALAETKDFIGTTGSISFDANRNPAKPAVVTRLQSGKFTYLESVEPR